MSAVDILRAEGVPSGAVDILHAEGVVAAGGRVRLLYAGGVVAPAPRARLLRAASSTVVTLAANAGPDITVNAGDRVTLNGRASSGRPDLWHWQLTGVEGEGVSEPTLHPSPDVDAPTLTAPYTPYGCVLRYTLYVALSSDEEYVASPDEVVITVRRHPLWIRRGGQLAALSLDAFLAGIGVAA